VLATHRYVYVLLTVGAHTTRLLIKFNRCGTLPTGVARSQQVWARSQHVPQLVVLKPNPPGELDTLMASPIAACYSCFSKLALPFPHTSTHISTRILIYYKLTLATKFNNGDSPGIVPSTLLFFLLAVHVMHMCVHIHVNWKVTQNYAILCKIIFPNLFWYFMYPIYYLFLPDNYMSFLQRSWQEEFLIGVCDARVCVSDRTLIRVTRWASVGVVFTYYW